MRDPGELKRLAVKAALVSGNPGKLRELRRSLPDWDLRPLETAGIGEEVGATFEENARAKAKWGRGRPHVAPAEWVIGEDSGLEVDALGGAPGIRSARFAGSNANAKESPCITLKAARHDSRHTPT